MSHSDNVCTADSSSHSPPPPPPPTPLKSSITSHHHVIDPDILLDRLGLEELGPPLLVPHHPSSHILTDTTILAPHSPHSLKTLSTLPERMSEESLEDSHAFTDITPNSSHVHHGSQDSMLLLEPLQEVVEEENEDGPTYKNPLMNSSMVNNHLMNDDAESYMAPLHFNVLRVSMSDVRLLGSSSTSNGPLLSLSSRSSSRSRTPRDVSPSTQSTDHHHPSIDPDILLDRLGLVELEPHHHPSNVDPNTSSSSSILTSGGGSSNPSVVVVATPLPSLPERMSDETLEDCHAFTEFKLVMRPRLGSASSSQSESGTTTPTTHGSCGNLVGLLPGSLTREGSVSGGSILGDASLLETLEEFDDEDDDDDEEEDGADHQEEHHEEGGKPPRMKKHFGKKLNSEKNLDIIEEKDSDL